MDQEDRSNKAGYFRDAVVGSGGRTYRFGVEDGRALEQAGNYWHGPGDPSTWLMVAVFLEARRRVAEAGDDIALELAAQALGITVDRLRKGIEWHEHYMQWHDADPDYRVL
jgi:hypothetical protein